MSKQLRRESFFQKFAVHFNPLASGLRECQIGAFCAVRSHFSISDEPCVVSLPTGSGKTALMMALSFGLKVQRVLVINPAEVLRLQTCEKFMTLDDLRKARALQGLSRKQIPNVYSIEKELRHASDWKSLSQYDIVTATTRTTSPTLENIVPPPTDLFDLIFIDEGHHAAAKTWKSLINVFNISKTHIILLTGTPYRRDNKSIGARIIYSYPIAKAIADGIYAPVNLVRAGLPEKTKRDDVLANNGIKQLKELKSHARIKPLLLVKTDRKSHADILGKIYSGKGISLGIVHSDQSQSENRTAIEAAINGKSDGLVVVGMLGEGLDIPALKIAVFHRNPQSLPYTLQVIGRLSRSKKDLPNGVVVACSNDFSRETFSLYDGSEDWLKLIPKLENQLITEIAPRHVEQVEASGAQIQLADVRSNFSVSVRYIQHIPVNKTLKDEEFDCQRGIFRIVLDKVINNELRVFITRAQETPIWLKQHGTSDVLDERFDIHTFYLGVKGILIRQSTDDSIGDTIQRAFAEEGNKIEPGKLNHVMSSLGGDYIVLGLKNVNAIGTYQPSYKMLLGQRVNDAISNIERANYHAGHCLARKNDGTNPNSEFRGVAYKRSRVWSLNRDNLTVLSEWMKVIAESIKMEGSVPLPELDDLRQPSPLVEYPSKPIAILFSPSLINKKFMFSHPDIGECKENPLWIPGNYTKQKLSISLTELNVEIIASIDHGSILFMENGSSQWRVDIFPVDGRNRSYTMQEFINEFPPTIIFEDGSGWRDNVFTRPSQSPVLNMNCLFPQNWKGCDIYREIPSDPRDGHSVHEFIESNFLLNKDNVLSIYDHTQGEVADYISFNTKSNIITLYHCKGGLRDKRTGKPMPPGVDQKLLEELVPQSLASSRWIKNSGLLEQLKTRMEKDIASIVSGTRAQFNQLASEFNAIPWTYEIILVQPGLNTSKVKKDNSGKRVRAILACADDYIKGCNASLKVFCS